MYSVRERRQRGVMSRGLDLQGPVSQDPSNSHKLTMSLVDVGRQTGEEPDLGGNNGGNGNNEDDLDSEFPLGDGTADLDAVVECPYCGESVEITLDPGSGSEQDYVEDCEVCCQPWRVRVRYDSEGQASVTVTQA